MCFVQLSEEWNFGANSSGTQFVLIASHGFVFPFATNTIIILAVSIACPRLPLSLRPATAIAFNSVAVADFTHSTDIVVIVVMSLGF